jgi:hypothetical protein
MNRFYPLHRIAPAVALLFALGLSACDSNEPDDDGPGEEELITRVTMTLTPAGGGSAVTITAENDSGIGEGGGIVLTPSTLTLAANTTYTGSIELLDTINNEDITEEVEEEDDEHQFFYTVSGLSGTTFTITDTDGNGLPVGLDYTVTTGSAGTGTLRVQLGHYDDQPKDGTTVSDETDLDFTLPLAVQ